MRYLHTMLRVRNLDAALKFYRDALGLKGKSGALTTTRQNLTPVFLVREPRMSDLLKDLPKTRAARQLVELTYNWDEENTGEDRYFGHLAYEVDTTSTRPAIA